MVGFLFLTSFIILAGGGSLLLLGSNSPPVWVFWVLAIFIAVFAGGSLILVAAMIFSFVTMGLTFLNILSIDPNVNERRTKCGFVFMTFYCLVDALRGSAFLALVVFSAVMHLDDNIEQPDNKTCGTTLHKVMYFLYWLQVI